MPTTSGSATTQKRAAPWAIRGVSLEARNAAMAAAKRDGMPLGEWLDRAIRHEVKVQRSQAVAPTMEETLAKLAESITQQAAATQQQTEQMQRDQTALAARLEAVEQRKADPEPGGFLSRLYGLLRRPSEQPKATDHQGKRD